MKNNEAIAYWCSFSVAPEDQKNCDRVSMQLWEDFVLPPCIYKDFTKMCKFWWRYLYVKESGGVYDEQLKLILPIWYATNYEI